MKPQTPRIKSVQNRRLRRLLDMEYKPSEIADELGINVKTIYRSYIPLGLPVRHAVDGSIWIHGTTYREWALTILTTDSEKPKPPMGESEFYCTKCRNRVQAVEISQVIDKRTRAIGTCPICGTSVTKFLKRVTE